MALRNLDDRVLGHFSPAFVWIRAHGPLYVVSLFLLSFCWAISVRMDPGGVVVAVVAVLLAAAYWLGALALALAVTDDMNERGAAGGWWGIAALVLGPIVGILWIAVRGRVARSEQ